MRQVELDPVQGHLHCRAERQIRPLDAAGCSRAPRKGQRKGQNKTPDRGKDDRMDIKEVIDKGYEVGKGFGCQGEAGGWLQGC